MTKKIVFHANRLYNKTNEKYWPKPTRTQVPKWFVQADKYEKDPITQEYYQNNEGGKLFSFKACPALLDVFTAGYLYTTPCDLTFFKDKNGMMNVKTEASFEDFCGARPQMKEFHQPSNYYKEHFHWYPNWAPKLPEGYSAIYTHPMNRFDLPFLTVSGIIDNDKMDTPGLMPFFLKEGFEGVIPQGTPYVQIIPFKRDDWEAEYKFYEYNDILKRHTDQANLYRTKDGGQYKKFTWSRKKYD